MSEHHSHNISDTFFRCYGCGLPAGDPKLDEPCLTPDFVGLARIRQHKPSSPRQLSFENFRLANLTRCEIGFGHKLTQWSEAEWTNATSGEVGEFAMALLLLFAKFGQLDNLTKKLIRFRDGHEAQNLGKSYETLLGEAFAEIGDIGCYLDLVCSRLGGRLEDCMRKAFNEKSDELGMRYKV